MATPGETMVREQLLVRRRRLESLQAAPPADPDVTRLLGEVDAALKRIEAGTYGLCETCHDAIEADRLAADPVIRYCLDHLTPTQQQALQEDLDLASKIQGAFLPDRTISLDGWEVAHHYEAAGPVSGDYCDLVPAGAAGLYFAVGDVTGKGVAASMLMAQLRASLRTLISLGLPLTQIVERASRAFCESTLPTHFATLACGKASADGSVEICNAGHPPPACLRAGDVSWVEPTGLPVGMFADARFGVKSFRLGEGDSLILYTDGLTETRNGAGDDYGRDRLARLIAGKAGLPSREIVAACTSDVAAFRARSTTADDLTIMAIRRTGA
jgi:sigma-B regulation protein RsbU (phosphoserine phosphatase)